MCTCEAVTRLTKAPDRICVTINNSLQLDARKIHQFISGISWPGILGVSPEYFEHGIFHPITHQFIHVLYYCPSLSPGCGAPFVQQSREEPPFFQA